MCEKAGRAGFMLVRGDLCSFTGVYARSREFMLVRGDLCSFVKIYARSQRFMLVHESYARLHNLRLPSTSTVEFRKKRFSFVTNVENERVFMNHAE
ncbi:hypothetical protein AWM68_04865 [Fictibacillus phosphorivorans]|uniref:Uncharacterized protein n=1 Tax=Fictibacillus phosphorivorans TaxID=1221500 RepID=A0A165NQE1_9BACL|nr:hypothetical protein AWM68_04865 [Fictibacillus phosphorivorans]